MMKVVQCWDDGVATDIRYIELLRKYDAKATFNLCPGTHGETRVEPSWIDRHYTGWGFRGFRGGKTALNEIYDLYKDFQVASHCWKHECAGRVPDADFFKAAVDARKFLEEISSQERASEEKIKQMKENIDVLEKKHKAVIGKGYVAGQKISGRSFRQSLSGICLALFMQHT